MDAEFERLQCREVKVIWFFVEEQVLESTFEKLRDQDDGHRLRGPLSKLDRCQKDQLLLLILLLPG